MIIGSMAFFHYSRARILLAGVLEESQRYIEQVKDKILGVDGIPASLKSSHICWDAISFKVLPNALEFLMYKFPK